MKLTEITNDVYMECIGLKQTALGNMRLSNSIYNRVDVIVPESKITMSSEIT